MRCCCSKTLLSPIISDVSLGAVKELAGSCRTECLERERDFTFLDLHGQIAFTVTVWLKLRMKLGPLGSLREMYSSTGTYLTTHLKRLPGVSPANKVTLKNWHLLKRHLYFTSRINTAWKIFSRSLAASKGEKSSKEVSFYQRAEANRKGEFPI